MDLGVGLLLIGVTGVLVVGAGGAAVALGAAVQVRRWSFVYLGHTVQIEIAALGTALRREVVSVDGVRVHTRPAGWDADRFVRRELRLEDGRALRFWFRTTGAACVVDDGTRVVFRSDGPADGEVSYEDPRLGAARALLADLAALDPGAADDLGVALERLLAAQRAALFQAAAHATLGGDAEALVARRDAEVEHLLSGLRELHLAVMQADSAAVVDARRALGRLVALAEVS
ncbi:MAG: hypothetical protein ABMA64_02005 [Myxococcota bacterium]